MNKYSPLLRTLKIALVCGATIVPFNHAEAGWNKMVDALTGTDDAHLAPLTRLCNRKLDGAEIPEKWLVRAGQLHTLNLITDRTLENVKMHLGDRGQYGKTKAHTEAAVPATVEKTNIARIKRHIASMETALNLAGTQAERDYIHQELKSLRSQLNSKDTIPVTALAPVNNDFLGQIRAVETALQFAETDREIRHYTGILEQLLAANNPPVEQAVNSNAPEARPSAVAPATRPHLSDQDRYELVKRRLRELDSTNNPQPAAVAVQQRAEVTLHRPVKYVYETFEDTLNRLQLRPGSILLLDIDGTLYHKRKAIDAEHATPEICQQFDRFLRAVESEFGAEESFSLMGARENSAYRTEDDLPARLKRLSESGVLVVPFTARSHTEAANTVQQLRDLGFDFASWNADKSALPADFFAGVTVINSIIFGTENHRDAGFKNRAVQALENRLHADGWAVPMIGMVDDTDVQIDQTAELNTQTRIPLHLVHYVGGKIYNSGASVRAFFQRNVQNFERYEVLFNRYFN